MAKKEKRPFYESECGDPKRHLELVIEGERVPCESDTAVDAAYLTYVAGTNGMHGGDAGHGGRAVLTLFGHDGFCIGAAVSQMYEKDNITIRPFETILRDAELVEAETDTAVSIVVEGDSEILCLADVLVRAGNALKKQMAKLSKEQ